VQSVLLVHRGEWEQKGSIMREGEIYVCWCKEGLGKECICISVRQENTKDVDLNREKYM
jgi:hypothetical protein